MSAVTRLDDMQALQAQLADEKIKRLEIAAIYTDKLAVLRAEHTKEMRESESKRLDAIRATDVAAVGTTATQAQAAIQALATTATATAETLRNQVTSTATTIANQTDRIVGPIMERIAALEKSSYTGLGKQAVVDPQMEHLSNLVETLVRSQATGAGRGEGMSDSVKMLVVVLTIATAFMGFYTFTQSKGAPAAAPVIYQLAPVAPLPNTAPATVPR
jgi:hypothetical protein